jgi:microcystin-dependent protein
MTTRSGSQTVTFVSATPEPVGNATSETASTWSSYQSGYYETSPAYNVIWENPVPINDLNKYLSSIPTKDAKRIVSLLEDNAKSLEDHLDSGYLKTSGGTVAGSTTFTSPVNFYSGVNLGQQSLYSMLPPVGSIMQYAGNKSPLGWLVCDGAEYSATLYPNLYNVLGSTYDTSTGLPAPTAGYFRVPNFKGRIPFGFDAGVTAFDTRGKSGGSLTIASANLPTHTHTGPSHTHTMSAHTHTVDGTDFYDHNHTYKVATIATAGTNRAIITASGTGGNAGAIEDAGIFGFPETDSPDPLNTGSDGTGATGNGGFTNSSYYPPYVTVNFIIKT